MSDRKLPIIRVSWALVAAAFFAGTPLTVLAQDDLSTELQRCSQIVEGVARLDCYDALSGRYSPAASDSVEIEPDTAAVPDQKMPDEEAVDVTTAGQSAVGAEITDEKAVDMSTVGQTAAATTVVEKEVADTKTLDDLGSATLPRGSRDEAEELEVRATVSKCEKDYRNKYRFYFDNGQIWKQTSDTRLSFRECNFDVTITKDFFGYKMKVDGDKRKIRISRVK